MHSYKPTSFQVAYTNFAMNRELFIKPSFTPLAPATTTITPPSTSNQVQKYGTSNVKAKQIRSVSTNRQVKENELGKDIYLRRVEFVQQLGRHVHFQNPQMNPSKDAKPYKRTTVKLALNNKNKVLMRGVSTDSIASPLPKIGMVAPPVRVRKPITDQNQLPVHKPLAAKLLTGAVVPQPLRPANAAFKPQLIVQIPQAVLAPRSTPKCKAHDWPQQVQEVQTQLRNQMQQQQKPQQAQQISQFQNKLHPFQLTRELEQRQQGIHEFQELNQLPQQQEALQHLNEFEQKRMPPDNISDPKAWIDYLLPDNKDEFLGEYGTLTFDDYSEITASNATSPIAETLALNNEPFIIGESPSSCDNNQLKPKIADTEDEEYRLSDFLRIS